MTYNWGRLLFLGKNRNIFSYKRISRGEVKEVLKRMKNGKAVGPDGIPIEV